MGYQIALIISEADFKKSVAEEVAKQIAALKKSMEVERGLPVRMSCKGAAAHLGISERNFHRNYSHLKKYEGRTVFVLSKDLS